MTVVVPGIAEPLTMKEQVYSTLRTLILNGKLLPGQALVEAQLTPQLGTSKTPLREAFLRLEADGLVTLSPRKGARVTKLSLRELSDCQYVRLNLEVAAFRLTAETITPTELSQARDSLASMRAHTLAENWDGYREVHRQFHVTLAEATRNPVLVKMLRDLFDRTQRYSQFCLGQDIPYWRQDEEDHHATLELLERKDEGAFGELFQRMNEKFAHYIDQALQRHDEALTRYFEDLPDEIATWRASRQRAAR
jgi:DNA-binding GntR family transcriptional regulator